MADRTKIDRDAEGLQLALRELFEETFERERLEEQAQGFSAEEAEQFLQDELPPRTLAHGYYRRAGYILELAASMDAGCHYDAAQLTHADVIGLKALKSARAAFEQEHPPCPRCGARQFNAFMVECHRCQQKFARAA